MATNNQTKLVAEPSKQELFITREFEAPRELVFRAFTDPELIPQWLGPCEYITKVDVWQAVAGGFWRLIHVTKDGKEYAFHGVCHEVTAPERIIRTFEFEGLPERGHVVLETASFEALPGDRTRLTIHAVHRSVESRDGMIRSGMQRGVDDSNRRLDELFERELQTK